MLEEKSGPDIEGNLNGSWFYKNLWGLTGVIWWNQKSFWYQELKGGAMDAGSCFGVGGSFLELTFTCPSVSKEVILSAALRVCGIPSTNWPWNRNWYF